MRPSQFALDQAAAGLCMGNHCTMPVEVDITVQSTWNSKPHAWRFCAPHAAAIVPFWAGSVYFLQIEDHGTYQGELPFD